MGPGGSCGLQNRLSGVSPSLVGSIPTRSRQLNYKASRAFGPGSLLHFTLVAHCLGKIFGKILP
jgi:hypothetical protein